MKILFFSHGKRANGGAERCLLDLVKGLKQARESWEIYVVFPAKDELWEMTRPYLSGYAFIRQPDRKSTRLNSSHMPKPRMPSSA